MFSYNLTNHILLVPLCLISKAVDLCLMLVGAGRIISKFPKSHQKTSLKMFLNGVNCPQVFPLLCYLHLNIQRASCWTRWKSCVRRHVFHVHNGNMEIKQSIPNFFLGGTHHSSKMSSILSLVSVLNLDVLTVGSGWVSSWFCSFLTLTKNMSVGDYWVSECVWAWFPVMEWSPTLSNQASAPRIE